MYVHTLPSAHSLANRIKELKDKKPELRVAYLSKEVWPYPFLLREYSQVFFFKIIPDELDFPIIITDDLMGKELLKKIASNYQMEHYPLRPGVMLDLYVSKSLL